MAERTWEPHCPLDPGHAAAVLLADLLRKDRPYALRRRRAGGSKLAPKTGSFALHSSADDAGLPLAARRRHWLDQPAPPAPHPQPDAGARCRRRSDRPLGRLATFGLAAAALPPSGRAEGRSSFPGDPRRHGGALDRRLS